MPWILEDTAGVIIFAEFFPLTESDLPHISAKLGWESSFDWSLYLQSNSIFTALKLVDSHGVIHGCLAYRKDQNNLFVELALVEKSPLHRRGVSYINIGKVLFAYAYKISFDAGFDGFVVLTPKTNLIDYYERVYRAQFVGHIDHHPRYLLDPAIGKSLIMVYYRERM